MKKILSIFLIIASFTVNGQAQYSDCLSPTSLRNFGQLKKYEKEIDEILLSKFSDYQLLSFRQSENIWTIELDSSDLKTSKYFITSVSPSKNIWNSMPKTDDIQVIKTTRNISKVDFELIKGLFSSALKTVCAKCHNTGIDGINYSISDMVISGKVWLNTPVTNELKKERLFSVCKEISDLIDADSEYIRIGTELRNEIKTLTKEFKKH